MMKNIYIIIALFSFLLLPSCSSDFLNENKELNTIVYQTDLYLDKSDLEANVLNFQLDRGINASYEIKSVPRGVSFDSFKGEIKNGVVNHIYRIDDSSFPTQAGIERLGVLRLYIDGVGSIIVNVFWVNEGTPIAEVEDDVLNFGVFEETLSISIYNKSANGILTWKIEEYPEWVEPSIQEGFLNENGTSQISIKCDRVNLEQGDHEGDLIIKTNDTDNPSILIKIRATSRGTTNPDNILAIKGDVKDAAYSKINEKLYVLTQNPNAMLVYNGTSGDVTEISLSKSPNCITLSEDGKTAYVGHSGQMSIIDLNSQSISKTVDFDFNIFDIAYGENSICYITVKSSSSSFYGYYQYNLETNSLSSWVSYSSNIYENTHLLKIINKPLIVATRSSVSPNGIILLDLSNPDGNQKYWHQSFGEKLWSTEDGNYLIGNYGHVFKTPSLSTSTENDLMDLGTLSNNTYNNYTWIEHNANTNVFYTITNDYHGNNEIRSYDAADYYVKDKVDFYDAYYTTINGVANHYPVKPLYLFSNKVGNQLYIIRNVVGSENIAWSLEMLKM
ncbi:MAG: YncE family protein [Dysgonomonas sp.]